MVTQIWVSWFLDRNSVMLFQVNYNWIIYFEEYLQNVQFHSSFNLLSISNNIETLTLSSILNVFFILYFQQTKHTQIDQTSTIKSNHTSPLIPIWTSHFQYEHHITFEHKILNLKLEHYQIRIEHRCDT